MQAAHDTCQVALLVAHLYKRLAGRAANWADGRRKRQVLAVRKAAAHLGRELNLGQRQPVAGFSQQCGGPPFASGRFDLLQRNGIRQVKLAYSLAAQSYKRRCRVHTAAQVIGKAAYVSSCRAVNRQLDPVRRAEVNQVNAVKRHLARDLRLLLLRVGPGRTALRLPA